MARKRKKEEVTVSFHYLARQKPGENEEPVIVPFSSEEFLALRQCLADLKSVDWDDEEFKDRLRFKNEVPIDKVELVDDRTIFGVFRSSYWGHAYENSERGKIPADSISLRPFHFLLYLSESGRIYVGSQYLGQFGGYTGLENTVRGQLADRSAIKPHSFRTETHSTEKIEPKEIRVSFHGKSDKMSGDNIFKNGGAFVLQRDNRSDEFGKKVSRQLFPFFGKSKDEMRKAIANLVNESDLISVKDEDISDCTIVGIVNGKPKTLHMLDGTNFATKFLVEVGFDDDGHPHYEPTKKEMIKVLQNNIISKSENV